MTIDFKRTPVTYHTYGRGEPVVLLHGFLESGAVWSPIVPWLSKDYQVIIIDLFGHGQTPLYSDISKMGTMAAMVHTVLTALQLKPTNMIGHSMGGYVIMAYLEKYPGTVERALLLNSSPKADNADRQEERDQVVHVAKKHKDILVKSGVRRLFAQENLDKFAPQINELIDGAKHMSPQAITAASMGMKQRPDRTDILRGFKGVKWIIAGKEDALIPLDTLKAVARETGCQLTTLPGGHMSYIEQADEVNNLITQFLATDY